MLTTRLALSPARTFADDLAGFDYFTTDFHYANVAAQLRRRLLKRPGFVVLSGPPPPDGRLVQRHLEAASDDGEAGGASWRALVVSCGQGWRFSNLIDACAGELGLRCEDAEDRSWSILWQLMQDFRKGIARVLIVGNADALADESFDELRSFTTLDEPHVLPVVLLTGAAFAERLETALAPLKPAMIPRLRLDRLSSIEVPAFIRHQIEPMGGWLQEAFPPETIGAIARAARGNPRVVNRLARQELDLFLRRRSLVMSLPPDVPEEQRGNDAAVVATGRAVERPTPSSTADPFPVAEPAGATPPAAAAERSSTSEPVAAMIPAFDGGSEQADLLAPWWTLLSRARALGLSREFAGAAPLLLIAASATAVLSFLAPPSRPPDHKHGSSAEAMVPTAAKGPAPGAAAALAVASAGATGEDLRSPTRLLSARAAPVPSTADALGGAETSIAADADAPSTDPQRARVEPAPADSRALAAATLPAARDDIPPAPLKRVSPPPAPEPATPAPEGAAGRAAAIEPSASPTAALALAEPSAAPLRSPAPAPAPDRALAVLVARGDRLLASGDIVSARQFYERAAEAGDAGASCGLGKSYDPLFLQQLATRGVSGDPAKAAAWYRRAAAAGSNDAALRLARLLAKYPSVTPVDGTGRRQ